MSKFTKKILSKLLTIANQNTKKLEQSLGAEIEYRQTLGRLSAQYTNLPLSLIDSLVTSTKEENELDFTFYRHPSRKRKFLEYMDLICPTNV